MKATEILKRQHREVKRLFAATKKESGASARRQGMDTIAEKLAAHMEVEEQIFYPAVAEVGTKKADEIVPEAYEEHHVARLVIDELPKVDPKDERWVAKMTVLEELIEHHVEEEESEIFKLADKLGSERLDELGSEMEAAFEARESAPRPRRAAAGR